jgi:hypothetical protein
MLTYSLTHLLTHPVAAAIGGGVFIPGGGSGGVTAATVTNIVLAISPPGSATNAIANTNGSHVGALRLTTPNTNTWLILDTPATGESWNYLPFTIGQSSVSNSFNEPLKDVVTSFGINVANSTRYNPRHGYLLWNNESSWQNLDDITVWESWRLFGTPTNGFGTSSMAFRYEGWDFYWNTTTKDYLGNDLHIYADTYTIESSFTNGGIAPFKFQPAGGSVGGTLTIAGDYVGDTNQAGQATITVKGRYIAKNPNSSAVSMFYTATDGKTTVEADSGTALGNTVQFLNFSQMTGPTNAFFGTASISNSFFHGNVGRATNSAGVAIDDLAAGSSGTGMQTNQWTTNVYLQPIRGEVTFTNTAIAGDQIQFYKTGDPVFEMFFNGGNKFRFQKYDAATVEMYLGAGSYLQFRAAGSARILLNSQGVFFGPSQTNTISDAGSLINNVGVTNGSVTHGTNTFLGGIAVAPAGADNTVGGYMPLTNAGTLYHVPLMSGPLNVGAGGGVTNNQVLWGTTAFNQITDSGSPWYFAGTNFEGNFAGFGVDETGKWRGDGSLLTGISGAGIVTNNYIARGSIEDTNRVGMFPTGLRYEVSGLDATYAAGLQLSNTTRSGLQHSPALEFWGSATNTTGGTSAPVMMSWKVVPASAATPTAQMQLWKSIGGAAPSFTQAYFSETGSLILGGGVTGNGDVRAGAASAFYFNGRGFWMSPASGTMRWLDSTLTNVLFTFTNGTLTVNSNITAPGTITGGSFIGNGAGLTNIGTNSFYLTGDADDYISLGGPNLAEGYAGGSRTIILNTSGLTLTGGNIEIGGSITETNKAGTAGRLVTYSANGTHEPSSTVATDLARLNGGNTFASGNQVFSPSVFINGNLIHGQRVATDLLTDEFADPDVNWPTNQSFSITLSGTPSSGQKITLTVTNYAATNIVLTTPEVYDYYSAAPSTSETIQANSISTFAFTYKDVPGSGLTNRWLKSLVGEKANQQLKAIAEGLFVTTNTLSFVSSSNSPPAFPVFAGGAQLWTDGTNLCVIIKNHATGTLTTNKVTLSAWP